jgi:hypothetical protein
LSAGTKFDDLPESGGSNHKILSEPPVEEEMPSQHKTVKCPQCGMETRSNNLKRHVDRLHAEAAPIIPSIDLSSPEFQAPNMSPYSLPPATLKAIADAKDRGEYLQEVDCYWNPPEAGELVRFANMLQISLTDYRFRDHSAYDISKIEDDIVNLNQAEKNEKSFTKQCDIREEIRKRTSYMNSMKQWKPQRRIITSIQTNDHHSDETIKKLMTVSDKYPKLVSKLVKVIEYRKQALAEMNKKRGNPMRSIYIHIVLTPMDFKAVCNWTITRMQYEDDQMTICKYKRQFLHATEYNLQGDEAVEYKSNEKLMEEKKQKEIDELDEKYKEKRRKEKEERDKIKAEKEKIKAEKKH